MKRILSALLVFGLLMSSMAAIHEASSAPMDEWEMQCVIGGEDKLDCEGIAAGTYALCKGLGGGWLACTIVAAGAYLACLGVNAL
jgi:hypothetical protein